MFIKPTPQGVSWKVGKVNSDQVGLQPGPAHIGDPCVGRAPIDVTYRVGRHKEVDPVLVILPEFREGVEDKVDAFLS